MRDVGAVVGYFAQRNAGEWSAAMSNEPFFRSYMPYLLAQAAHHLSMPFHRELKARGIREMEWRVLATLYGSGGKSVNEIAGEVLVPQSTLSRRLAKMEDAGLVARRGDVSDRRVAIITLSEAGRQCAAGLISQASLAETRDTASLSESERKTLRALLARLVAHSRR